MARSADPLSYATVVGFVYFRGIPYGVLRPDDSAVREIEAALRMAERSGDDLAVAHAGLTLGVAVVHRHTDAERSSGQKLLAETSDAFLRQGQQHVDFPAVPVDADLPYIRRKHLRLQAQVLEDFLDLFTAESIAGRRRLCRLRLDNCGR